MKHIACDIKIAGLERVLKSLIESLESLSNPEPYNLAIIPDGPEKDDLIRAWKDAERELLPKVENDQGHSESDVIL